MTTGRMRRRRLAGMGVGLSLAMVLTGCGSQHGALGAGINPCFIAIPQARRAVGHAGRFVGVKRVPASAAWHYSGVAMKGHEAVCVIGFERSGNDQGKGGPRYTVAVVTSPGNRVLAVSHPAALARSFRRP